jgi:hypothetical protein
MYLEYSGALTNLLLDSLVLKIILMIGTYMEMAHLLKYEYYTVKLEDE